jgi:hypothetical protein
MKKLCIQLAHLERVFSCFYNPRSPGLQSWDSYLSQHCLFCRVWQNLKPRFPTRSVSCRRALIFPVPCPLHRFYLVGMVPTPLVRRLADYRSGFTDPSPILLAPYLVALLTLITFLQNVPILKRQGGLPFVLSFIGLFYAF